MEAITVQYALMLPRESPIATKSSPKIVIWKDAVLHWLVQKDVLQMKYLDDSYGSV